MWMLNPRDEVAQKIDDQVPVYVVDTKKPSRTHFNFPKMQFMLGDEILVAPVLSYGQRKRDVYLPGPGAVGMGANGTDPGPRGGETVWWKRGSDGSFLRGGGWRRDMDAPVDQVRDLNFEY